MRQDRFVFFLDVLILSAASYDPLSHIAEHIQQKHQTLKILEALSAYRATISVSIDRLVAIIRLAHLKYSRPHKIAWYVQLLATLHTHSHLPRRKVLGFHSICGKSAPHSYVTSLQGPNPYGSDQ